MKKSNWFVLAVIMSTAFLVFSCEQGTTPKIKEETPVEVPPAVEEEPIPEPVKGLFIYDSAWVRQTAIETLYKDALASRAIGTMTLSEYVESQNKASRESQLFVFEKEVPIEEAPLAMAYIVDPVSYDPISIYTDVPRTDFIDRREVWRAQTYACAGVLFVDQIPVPPPVVVDTRTDYEKYSLYIINPDGSIYAEEHCTETDLTGLGYASVEAYYEERRTMFNTQAYALGYGFTVVAGAIYTPPEI